MDEKDLPKSKRQRLAVVSKNEAKDTHKISSTGVLTIPSGVLGNCFSFLGPSGHYYFLASVCKDFKLAVDELYQGNCNTSIDAIITSISTLRHVQEVIRSDDESYYEMYEMIYEAIYKHDRPDLLEFLGVHKYTLSMAGWDFVLATLEVITTATEYNSTEIMRLIISNEMDTIARCLMIDGFDEIRPDLLRCRLDIKHILSKSSAACDPEMICQMVERGVKFDNESIEYSLTRADLDTYKCLLDIVHVEDEQMKKSIISKAVKHELNLDALKCLKEKKYFENEETLAHAMGLIFGVNVDMDIACVEHVLNSILEDRFENNDIYFGMVLICCIAAGRMDIVRYMHETFRRIDNTMSRLLIQAAENTNISGIANFRRTVLTLP